MNTIDWATYKFHCSGLKNLLTASRKKDEVLSEGTKSYLNEIWVEETFGRVRSDMVANKFTQKGIRCETDTIELVERVTGSTYFKNNTQLTNEWVTGTPDIVKPDLIDIKTSWDLFTFGAITADKAAKDYYYQLLGYMWLLNKDTSQLIYGLVNTPEDMIGNDLYRLSYQLPEDEIEKYRQNYIFDDIPEQMKVKRYCFTYSEEDVKALQTKILASREYLGTLAL